MTMNSRILRSVAFAALVAAMPAHAADKIAKIGVLAPLTGQSAADAKEMVDGAKLAIDEINAAGGVAGYKLQAVVGDARDGSADAVTSAIERLTGDRDLNAIVTGYTSANNFEINLMAEQEMPYMLYGSANQTRDIIAAHPDKFPTVWSLSPSFDAYETETVPVLQRLEKSGSLKLPNKKVAFIAADIPITKGVMNGLITSFKDAGGTITSTDLIPWGPVEDWRTFLTKVRQDNPAVIMNIDPETGNAAKFITQFLEQPTDSIVYIQYVPAIPEFLKLTGKKGTGVIYSVIGGTIPSARTSEIVKKISDKYGYEPGSTAPAVYEEVMIYADALKKVGDPTKRLAIGKAIGETHKEVAQGTLSFDPKTHLAVGGDDALPMAFYQIWDGKHVLFSPKRIANGEFHMPPWMKQ